MVTRPLYLLLLGAIASAAAIAFRPARPASDLTVWVFSADHARLLTSPWTDLDHNTHPSLIEQYRLKTGKRVFVELIGGRGLDTRLLSLLGQTPGHAALLPDVVEIEIGSLGLYLRPPVEKVPLLALDKFLDGAGLRGRLSARRLATWSKSGQAFGLPLDVHPVVLVYRDDLFEQAGIYLDTITSWPQLADACGTFAKYCRAHGRGERVALALHSASSDELQIMLQQRHVQPIGADGKVRIDDMAVARTVAFYATLVASPRGGEAPIAADPTPGPGKWADDLARGDRCAAIVADWALADLALHPELAGKLRIAPLPHFDRNDAPTASWGGTAAAIPGDVRDPATAWDLLQFLYASPQAADARAAMDPDVLSAFPQSWRETSSGAASGFFGNQDAHAILDGLARQLPDRVVSPLGVLAALQLSRVLGDARAAREDGDGLPQLTARCSSWLSQAADDLRRQIEFERLDK